MDLAEHIVKFLFSLVWFHLQIAPLATTFQLQLIFAKGDGVMDSSNDITFQQGATYSSSHIHTQKKPLRKPVEGMHS